MDVDVDADLDGVSLLSEVVKTASCARRDSKCIIMCVCDVTTPEADDHRTEVVVGMGAHEGIELLTVGVGLVPPDLTLTVHVGTKGELTYMPVEHGTGGVLGYEGHVVVRVIINI